MLKAKSNTNKSNLHFSDETLKILTAYEWKGNVRELEAAVEYAALRARGNEIMPEDLPVKMISDDLEDKTKKLHLAGLYGDLPTMDELQKRYLIYVLEQTEGNRTRAAEILEIDRRTLYRMIERFGIELD